MVDTKKIRKNLSSRDSIGLKREDVLELLEVYDIANPEEKWAWVDFEPKH